MDRQLVAGGSAGADEPARGGVEVADRTVFVRSAAGVVPALAGFAAAAYAGDRVGAARADPGGGHGEEPWAHGHAEAAVAVQQGGAGALIFVGRGEQEQRDLGAVAGGIANAAAADFRRT